MSKNVCGDGVRVAYPLFNQAGGGGSIPTSPLQLTLEQIDFLEAKKLNRIWHSRLPRMGTGAVKNANWLSFGAEFDGRWYAAAIWSNPVCRWLPQQRWLELRRLAIAPDAPKNTASRVLKIMAILIRKLRPEVVRLISYQDTEVHTGGIYRAAGWTQMNVRSKKKRYSWGCRSRPRPKAQSEAVKIRWEKYMGKINWTELNPPEKSRTYTFSTGLKITYENVVRIEVRESGKHRIETADGKKAFICPGWIALDIDVPEWTF